MWFFIAEIELFDGCVIKFMSERFPTADEADVCAIRLKKACPKLKSAAAYFESLKPSGFGVTSEHVYNIHLPEVQ